MSIQCSDMRSSNGVGDPRLALYSDLYLPGLKTASDYRPVCGNGALEKREEARGFLFCLTGTPVMHAEKSNCL